MAHLAFVSLPAAGHVNSTLPLVAELVRRGHRVTCSSGGVSADAITADLGVPLEPPTPRRQIVFLPRRFQLAGDTFDDSYVFVGPTLAEQREDWRPSADARTSAPTSPPWLPTFAPPAVRPPPPTPWRRHCSDNVLTSSA